MAAATEFANVEAMLPKCPTGILGLDEITQGGVPRGRPTLICGGAGCGKTVMAMEFIVRGATQYDEPGVFMAFEENPQELAQNVRSMGFDLKSLVDQKKLALSWVRVERNEIEETGEYDLEGLFVRLGYAIDSVKAKRVVLDTIESLFSGLSNTAILRAELRRLFRWLKDKGVTAIITGERGDATLTRQGLEEYVSDCVIMLDHRVIEQLSTRRMRIVKYRGTAHGTNEYPFIIDERGIDVLPVTSLGLTHKVCLERVSSGIPALDKMLIGGFYRGSSILLSGTAGTGKTTGAAAFLNAACQRGERCLCFSFEESMAQTLRNMRSVGIDLEAWTQKKLLQFHAARPTMFGLEMHLAAMFKAIREFKPRNVVIDPITGFTMAGQKPDVCSMLMRLTDYLKSEGITSYYTGLTSGAGMLEATGIEISSLMDTWLLVRNIELSGERNRVMYILKSRGMAHSNQVCEFVLTSQGIELRPAYLGPGGALTGSARLAQEARDSVEAAQREQDVERKQRELERERMLLDARIAALKSEFQNKEDGLKHQILQAKGAQALSTHDREQMAISRNVLATPQKS